MRHSQLQTLSYTITHSLKEGILRHYSDQTGRVPETSTVPRDIGHALDLLATNGGIDQYNCLDVISFSNTFNDFTFNCFDGFSSCDTRSLPRTTTSARTQDRVLSVSCLVRECMKFCWTAKTNKRCKHPNIFDILASSTNNLYSLTREKYNLEVISPD